MSVAAQILIAAATAGSTSAQLKRSAADGLCTIVAAGLAGTETVKVQIQAADGTFVDVAASPACQLTASVNTVALPGPGIYQFVKSATVAAVGVVAYSI